MTKETKKQRDGSDIFFKKENLQKLKEEDKRENNNNKKKNFKNMKLPKNLLLKIEELLIKKNLKMQHASNKLLTLKGGMIKYYEDF